MHIYIYIREVRKLPSLSKGTRKYTNAHAAGTSPTHYQHMTETSPTHHQTYELSKNM